MNAEDFRHIALGLEKAIEGEHMDHPDFRVNGRIFATIHPDHRYGMVALTAEQQERFVREQPDAFAPENGAWGRNGCTRVTLDSVDEDALGEAMTLAWQNAVAKGATRRSQRSRFPPRRTRRTGRNPKD